MEEDVRAFRRWRGRMGSGSACSERYSPDLGAQAVRYWRVRREAGESLRDVAGALGVAPGSLHRWTRPSPTRAGVIPCRSCAPSRRAATRISWSC